MSCGCPLAEMGDVGAWRCGVGHLGRCMFSGEKLHPVHALGVPRRYHESEAPLSGVAFGYTVVQKS